MSKKPNRRVAAPAAANRHRRRPRWRSWLLLVFGVGVVVMLFLLVREVRRPPAHDSTRSADPTLREANPLTDVAPRPRDAYGGRGAGPRRPAAADTADDDQPRAEPEPFKLPPDLPDPAHPPQWTEPLAVPGEPRPPDPFTPPEISQDPDRGRRPADQGQDQDPE